MPSESARMSSAAEARFRVQAPNSKPRAIKVIALDAASEGVVQRLMKGSWSHASFFTAAAFARSPRKLQAESEDGWLTDLSGRARNLTDEIENADLVVMVAAPGGKADVASIVGEACSRKRINTTALIAGATAASDEALSRTLKQVRPWSLMVVIAEADDYIDDMLAALRA
jgi:UDP-N-acetylmuramate-alanine ligase